MIGSLIGAGIGAVGSVIGAIASKNATQEANRIAAQQRADNQAWYDRRYNEDATQRADAQRILTMTMDRIRQQNKNAAGTQAVMGGSEESVAAAKAAGANALADTASQIAASGAERKDAIENQYLTNKQALTAQQIANKQQQAANIGAAAQGVGQAAVGAGQAYDQYKQQGEYNKLMEMLINNGKKP